MAELDKVIKGLKILMNGCAHIDCDDCCFYISTKPTRCGLREEQIQEDALALLKEQDDMGKELGDAVELIHKKNERIEKLLKEQETQKFFVDESGKITPLPVVVRCKDCANGEVRTQSWDGVQYVECHAHEEEGYDHEDGHPLYWFCADGERK